MRAQTPSAHTSAPTAPTALTAYTLTPPHRLHPHPARPLLPPLTALHRKLIQASNACPNPLPHRPHRLHPHPARPLLPPLTAVHRKFLQASNACPFPARPLLPPLTAVDRPNPLRPHHPHRPHRLHPHPARPLLPPLTAVDRKFLQASNACPNPSAHTTPGLYAKRSDPNSARVRCLFLLDSMPACVCLLWAKLGIVQSVLCRHCTQDISFSNATLRVLISTAALQDWGSAALAAAIKSGSAAGPFCGRGRGPPELGEAVKAKPLREARHCRRPSSAASRGSR